jgi:hypothetical protein
MQWAKKSVRLPGMTPVSERGKRPRGRGRRPRGQDGLSAHRRPGYPLVGLLASRARLRFTRRGEDTAKASTRATPLAPRGAAGVTNVRRAVGKSNCRRQPEPGDF